MKVQINYTTLQGYTPTNDPSGEYECPSLSKDDMASAARKHSTHDCDLAVVISDDGAFKRTVAL